MVFSNNPERDADRYEWSQESELANCEHCAECGEPIQDDYAYRFGEDIYCEECVESHRFRLY